MCGGMWHGTVPQTRRHATVGSDRSDGAGFVTDIAVVGLACRLPGGIDSPEALWDTLIRGTDLVDVVPRDRWNADDYYDAEVGVPGRSVSRWGAFLSDPTGFDFPFFGISEREALAMDPQHRVLLEVTWEAAERSGIDPARLRGSDTGVFFGLSHQDYSMVTRNAGALSDAYSFTGIPFSMASGRVAHAMDLRGPALTLDTACSSSLVAIHTARRALDAMECNMAFAGGVMLMFSPQSYASASGLGMLSPTGRCQPFDARADGFVRAEGCGVVVLKRLSDARRDNDRILAVIRGTAVNHDGRTDNILAPSSAAQVAVIHRALADAGVEASSIGVVEAHGTGTAVGDTIEYRSLSQVYGRSAPCAVGALKSNLGHAESAAGVLGLIKTVLSLQHGVVPRVLHFDSLPEPLQRIDTQLFVPTQSVPWPAVDSQHVRRAAVSSYGMSGTNAHAILEYDPADASQAPPRRSHSADDRPRLIPLSSTSPEGLQAFATQLATQLDAQISRGDDVPSLADVAYTLSCRRGHRPVRHAMIARTTQELSDELRVLATTAPMATAAVDQESRGPVFLFSGQGSQWPAMGEALLRTDAVFATTIAEIEPMMRAVAGFSVTEALQHPDALHGIDRIQPSIFAVQVALAASLRARGVMPSAVIGHSLGEVSAAVVSGALSLDDGIRVICHRSLLCRLVAGQSAMAVVELSPAAIREVLVQEGIDDVEIAVLTAPTSSVIGGAVASVQRLIAAWQRRDVFAREVAVDVASHTSQVNPILDELRQRLDALTPQRASVPMYSTTLLDPRAQARCDAEYWVDNLRYPVRFRAAVEAALEDGHRVFVELSPHPLLTRAIAQNAAAADLAVRALPSMSRGEGLSGGVLGLVGALYTAGAAVDFSVLQEPACLVDLPLPAWTHHRLFLAPTAGATDATGMSLTASHPLLTVHRTVHEEPRRHVWAAELGLGAHPWLADHQINGVPAFPGAGFCEIALEGARRALGASAEVHDLRFERALLLEQDTPGVATAVADGSTRLTFSVESQRDVGAERHATAVLADCPDEPDPACYDVAAERTRHPTTLAASELWRWFGSRGIHFGPSFRALAANVALSPEGRSVFAELRLPAALRAAGGQYRVHPVLLDACFQSVAALAQVPSLLGERMLLPLSVRRVRAYGSVAQAAYCVTRLVAVDAVSVEADIDVIDASGTVVLRVRGLVMGTGMTHREAPMVACNDRLLDVTWTPWDVSLEAPPTVLPNVTTPTTSRWLLVHGSESGDDLASELHALLEEHGASAFLVPALTPGGTAHETNARLRAHLDDDVAYGVLVCLPPANDAASPPDVARRAVSHVVHVAQLLAERITERTAERVAQARDRRPRLYVVTRSAQQVLPDDVLKLDHVGVRGALRSIGAEFPSLHPTQIDVDAHADRRLLVAQLLSGSREDETSIRGTRAYTARIQRSPLTHDDRQRRLADGSSAELRMEIRVPGDLETLELVAVRRRSPRAGQIEIAVCASSVNFADVLVAFGRYPSFDGQQLQPGLDFVGVVAAVGDGVTTHRVGDRVAGMLPGGCWGTTLTCDAVLAVPVPNSLSDTTAAALLTATATAWHGLHDLARITAGDRVLIHSATGGVGQAALAIAMAAGAEVFATAGTEAKRALLRTRGVRHVYDSRSLAFADEIRRNTGGAGVDIVLNSLTGAAQRAGVELLAFGGRFIELGKKDIYGNTWLGLAPFRRNLSFSAVDLALMCTTAPERLRQLLSTVIGQAAAGRLTPPDVTTYPLADAVTAIRVMSTAEHVGKLILTISRTGPVEVPRAPQHAHPFRHDGAYIVTGGLRGLGLFLAERMATAGCGRLVLNARSEPAPAEQARIDAIRTHGTSVDVVVGDIADAHTAATLVAVATATGLPLRGVLHAAAVVEDGIVTWVSDDLIARNWGPKAHGAWQLHLATQGLSLDWFCLFSSIAALFGSPGQTAYAAANCWLDGLTRWRRSLGLPANTIAWGAWEQIGAGAHLAAHGDTTMIVPDDGAFAFEWLLRHNRAYAAYSPLTGTPWLTALAQRSPTASALLPSHTGTTDTVSAHWSALALALTRAPRDEWPAMLRRLVLEQTGVILRRVVDPDRPFSDYGLDSLGTLQLLTAIENETGIRLRAKQLSTVRALAETLSESLAASMLAAPTVPKVPRG